ncbi:MAG TPA: response regulator [Chthoniobacter sp.]|nr:response regulator [Chthoniobacter sp.]
MNQNLPPSPGTARSSPKTPGTATGSAMRILIVDDDPLLCGLHALLLEQQGYDTVTAENGQDALTQLASGDFDLVITDCKMPILDGPSMVLALRSAGSRIPVIMISGTLAFTPLPRAVAREVCIALVKPAHPKEILAAVATALAMPRASKGSHPFPSRFKTAAEADAYYMID